MNGYSFTNRVRKVLAMSREEALRLHHEYVGTEHILLGLLREGEGVASTVLENLSIDADWITQRIEELVKRGNAEPATGPELPYTSRAKKVLELAMAEAHDLHHCTSAPSTSSSDCCGRRRESQRRCSAPLASRPRRRAPRPCASSVLRRRSFTAGPPGEVRGVTIELRNAGGWILRHETATIGEAIAFLRSNQ